MRAEAAALTALLLAAGCHGEPGAFTADDEAAVRGVLMAQRDAWNRGDLDGFMTGYLRSPQLVFTSGAKIRRGYQVTRDRFRERYGDEPSGLGHLEFRIEDVRGLGADGAVVLGHWHLTETPEAGDGVFTVVFERRPEGWRIVHDHTSATPPTTP